MTTPEPLDEHPAGPVETRGGDRDEDFMPAFATGGLLPGPDLNDLNYPEDDAYDEDYG